MHKRTPQKRFRHFVYDIRSILRSHGFFVLVAYLLVKAGTKIPLLGHVLRRVTRNQILVRTRILEGDMFLNLLDPGISYQLLVHGIRERAHVEQIQGAIEQGMQGIDIGANIGYYALLESRLVGPQGHVFCIEPAPSNFRLLQKNIAQNGFQDRTTCTQYLVGERNGAGKLFLSPAANSHSVAKVSEHFVELPMVTLDEFAVRHHCSPSLVDFLRMDIEGYEVLVLQHIQSFLRERKKPLKLFIELHPAAYSEWGWSLSRLLEHLSGLGFSIRSVVQENTKDEQGNKVDKIIEVEDGRELVQRFGEWNRTGGQRGIWAFFEFPATL